MLGGQHISAAIYKSYMAIKTGGGQMKEYYKYVKAAVILNPQTPKKFCRLAAGFHQSVQQNVDAVGLSDIMAHLGALSEELMKTATYPLLTDDQLYVALLSCGVTKPPSMKDEDTDIEPHLGKGSDRQEKQVRFFVQFSFTITAFFSASEVQPVAVLSQLCCVCGCKLVQV